MNDYSRDYRFDKRHRFYHYFNRNNGLNIRSGVIDSTGRDTGEDPFMSSFPHLIDIGIMGHCSHAKSGLCQSSGIECYQDAVNVEHPNMSLENFRRIISECNGKVSQVALGGRGDPDQHENFADIIRMCNLEGITPNFTSSGIGITREIASLCKEHCGAVAISWHDQDHTLAAIETLLKENVRTNIHYVLGNNTLRRAIELLQKKRFPSGINALIFLLHKPVGMGTKENVLRIEDSLVANFFEIINSWDNSFKIGVDSCSAPALINLCKETIYETIDTCEGARFSCYIGEDMKITPCSFDVQRKYGVSLHEYSIQEAWDSDLFKDFRNCLLQNCLGCSDQALCLGGCPLNPEIVLCDREIRYNLNI